MIVTRTYLSKTNTIVRDCPVNTGLNPILELNYGKMMSRGLIYFDHSKIKEMVEDSTYPDITKLTHVLHMHNAASFNDLSQSHRHECLASSQFNEHKRRAVSFDLLFFLIPQDWDEGVGFDYIQDVWREGQSALSTKASNWYKSDTLHRWPEYGIYSTDYLSGELDIATLPDGNRSRVIIGWQHFDRGNEDICLDVTEIVNKFITGEVENHGIGIAFFPSYEDEQRCDTQYVGFHTHHTHSFFEPYVETTYDEVLEDSRADFYLDKENRLYFYANVGGKAVILDDMPKCEIDGVEYDVKLATRGAYYIELLLGSDEHEPDTMYYDTWSNIIYRGRRMPNVELSFTTKSDGYFSFGLPSANNTPAEYIPSLYGISHQEKVPQGDIRKVSVVCKVPYTSDTMANVDGVEYRVYVWMADRQIDIVDWRPVERGYNEMFFLLDTGSLVPFRYNVDIRVRRDKELTHHKDMLTFDIVNNYTEQKN